MGSNKSVKTEKELAKAIENKEDSIIIEGDLANKVVRIKATGKVAWAVCGVSLATAIGLIIATPEAAVVTAPAGGAGGAISFTGGVAIATPAAATLGTAVVPAIMIGVAAGGIGVLNTIRDKYYISEKRKNYLCLKRK